MAASRSHPHQVVSWRTVRVVVELTAEEAEGLRDGVFACTTEATRLHQAGRRALLKVREAVAEAYPRPPLNL